MTPHITGIRRASPPMGLRIALLFSVVLWALIISLAAVAFAQQAPPNSPVTATPLSDPANDARTAQVLRQAQAALAAAQAAAQQAALIQAATQPVPPPQTIAIPAEIRDAVVSLCGLLITAGIGVALTWMRGHLAFMKEAGANAAITSSAQGLGALLEQELAKQGRSLSSVSISDPNVAAAAQKLIASYPEWAPLVGLTQDIAERKVLAGAIQQSAVPLVPTEPVTVVQPTPPLAVVSPPRPPPPPPTGPGTIS